MKKLTIIFLLIVYALSTLGISINEFYCCGKLQSVRINVAYDVKEQCEKGDENTGCCKTNQQFFKVKDSHLAFADIFACDKYFCDIDFTNSFFETSKLEKNNVSIANSIHSPPYFSNTPLYIIHCVFRI